MKRLLSACILIAALPAVVLAGGPEQGLNAEDIYSISPGLEGKTLADVEVDDILMLAEGLSIDIQEDMYVKKAALSSLFIPGTGQFMTGDTGLGVAQLSLHFLIVGGTAFGAYMLLPEDLQNSLDNYGETKAYFETLTYSELLPATGVMLGGMLLNGILAGWSSHGAAESARRNIEDGSVTFAPDLRLVGGLPFIGMSMRH
jgi:TM2 domain-containing membrane protein YozV